MKFYSKIFWFIKLPFVLKVSFFRSRIIAIIWRESFHAVGPGFRIGSGAVIRGGGRMEVGRNFCCGRFLWLEAVELYNGEHNPKITIGNDVIFSDFVHVASADSVCIGNDVLVGSKVHITDHSHGSYSGEFQDDPETPPAKRKLTRNQKVEIGDRCWIGDGVVILPGVKIGSGAIVGANSVVTKDVPVNSMVCGVPARIIKVFDPDTMKWVVVKGECL